MTNEQVKKAEDAIGNYLSMNYRFDFRLAQDIAGAILDIYEVGQLIEEGREQGKNAVELFDVLKNAQKELTALQDHLDLMVDEFKRIQALTCPQAFRPDSEIHWLCERAIRITKQHVPVFVQRDKWQRKAEDAETELASLREENARLKAELESKQYARIMDEDLMARYEQHIERLEKRVDTATPVTIHRAQGHTVIEIGDKAAILPWPWDGMQPGERKEMILVDKPGQS